jgi:hypothetical protein
VPFTIANRPLLPVASQARKRPAYVAYTRAKEGLILSEVNRLLDKAESSIKAPLIHWIELFGALD